MRIAKEGEQDFLSARWPRSPRDGIAIWKGELVLLTINVVDAEVQVIVSDALPGTAWRGKDKKHGMQEEWRGSPWAADLAWPATFGCAAQSEVEAVAAAAYNGNAANKGKGKGKQYEKGQGEGKRQVNVGFGAAGSAARGENPHGGAWSGYRPNLAGGGVGPAASQPPPAGPDFQAQAAGAAQVQAQAAAALAAAAGQLPFPPGGAGALGGAAAGQDVQVPAAWLGAYAPPPPAGVRAAGRGGRGLGRCWRRGGGPGAGGCAGGVGGNPSVQGGAGAAPPPAGLGAGFGLAADPWLAVLQARAAGGGAPAGAGAGTGATPPASLAS